MLRKGRARRGEVAQSRAQSGMGDAIGFCGDRSAHRQSPNIKAPQAINLRRFAQKIMGVQGV
jgi:hypothetical protein